MLPQKTVISLVVSQLCPESLLCFILTACTTPLLFSSVFLSSAAHTPALWHSHSLRAALPLLSPDCLLSDPCFCCVFSCVWLLLVFVAQSLCTFCLFFTPAWTLDSPLINLTGFSYTLTKLVFVLKLFSICLPACLICLHSCLACLVISL